MKKKIYLRISLGCFAFALLCLIVGVIISHRSSDGVDEVIPSSINGVSISGNANYEITDKGHKSVKELDPYTEFIGKSVKDFKKKFGKGKSIEYNGVIVGFFYKIDAFNGNQKLNVITDSEDLIDSFEIIFSSGTFATWKSYFEKNADVEFSTTSGDSSTVSWLHGDYTYTLREEDNAAVLAVGSK